MQVQRSESDQIKGVDLLEMKNPKSLKEFVGELKRVAFVVHQGCSMMLVSLQPLSKFEPLALLF